MDSKMKVELLKISLAMRKARQCEKQQEALKKNEQRKLDEEQRNGDK